MAHAYYNVELHVFENSFFHMLNDTFLNLIINKINSEQMGRGVFLESYTLCMYPLSISSNLSALILKISALTSFLLLQLPYSVICVQNREKIFLNYLSEETNFQHMSVTSIEVSQNIFCTTKE